MPRSPYRSLDDVHFPLLNGITLPQLVLPLPEVQMTLQSSLRLLQALSHPGTDLILHLRKWMFHAHPSHSLVLQLRRMQIPALYPVQSLRSAMLHAIHLQKNSLLLQPFHLHRLPLPWYSQNTGRLSKAVPLLLPASYLSSYEALPKWIHNRLTCRSHMDLRISRLSDPVHLLSL